MKSPSKSFRGTGEKILKSLAYCLLGGVATFLLTINDSVDLGEIAPFIGALAPLFANMINEYLKERK